MAREYSSAMILDAVNQRRTEFPTIGILSANHMGRTNLSRKLATQCWVMRRDLHLRITLHCVEVHVSPRSNACAEVCLFFLSLGSVRPKEAVGQSTGKL